MKKVFVLPSGKFFFPPPPKPAEKFDALPAVVTTHDGRKVRLVVEAGGNVILFVREDGDK